MSTLSTLVIVACIATFIVMGVSPSRINPQNLDPLDVHKQCKDRGFLGACIVKQDRDEFLMNRCDRLACGKFFRSHMVAYNTKHALDGTFCAPNYVCKKGKCTEPSKIVSPGGVGATLKCRSSHHIPSTGNRLD